MSKVFIWILTLFYSSLVGATELPKWAENQSRMLIEDKITYWGTGLGNSPEIAVFKAEFMSIRGIKSECGGYASKGISIPKRLLKEHGRGYVAYVRASIPFVECDYNKTPMAKNNKDLKNKYFEDGLKLYDKLIANEFKNSKKPKSRNGDIGKVRKDILNYMNLKNKEQEARIAVIEEELKRLKKQKIVQNITIQKKEVHYHGNEATYMECIEDYNELMRDARRASQRNRPPGNLVGEHSRGVYNKAQRKLSKCRSIKENMN